MTDAIDLDHLDQYICGDSALLDEILTIFVEQAEGWSRDMHAGMDDDAWRRAAHTLKGASRGVGAWALGDIAERAELMTGDDAATARVALLRELSAASDAAITFARKVRDEAA